jgi:hypothetical protein
VRHIRRRREVSPDDARSYAAQLRRRSAHGSCSGQDEKEAAMANITTRRNEPREALASILDPARALDPFRLIRDLIGGKEAGGKELSAGREAQKKDEAATTQPAQKKAA